MLGRWSGSTKVQYKRERGERGRKERRREGKGRVENEESRVRGRR